jgi:hypothetical protein
VVSGIENDIRIPSGVVSDTVVHKTGDESVGGVKTFAASPVLSAEGANRLATFSPDKKLTGIENTPRPGQILLSAGSDTLPQWGDIVSPANPAYTLSVNLPAIAQNAKNVQVTLAKGAGNLLLDTHLDFLHNGRHEDGGKGELQGHRECGRGAVGKRP